MFAEPGITNFDFAAHRYFHIKEPVSLQFRTEFFNMFNTPQLASSAVFSPFQFRILTVSQSI